MRTEEYLTLTGKSANDHVTFADLVGIAAEKPPVDEKAEARGKKRAELAAQIAALDAGKDIPEPAAPAPPSQTQFTAAPASTPAPDTNAPQG